MPKLTEKEILARLDEADAKTLADIEKTLADIEKMLKAGHLPNNIKLATGAPIRVVNAVAACIAVEG